MTMYVIMAVSFLDQRLRTLLVDDQPADQKHEHYTGKYP